MAKAEIREIYSAIQGEGKYAGSRHIFLRFMGCNLNCSYCDTKLEKSSNYGRYEKKPASRNFLRLKNPASVKRVFRIINTLNRICHEAVSLTGGEPLLHVDFLKELLPLLKKNNYSLLLETNGTLYQSLGEIINLIDIVSMDMKLPSSNEGRSFWDLHYNFLKAALKKEVYVKIVINGCTTNQDIEGSIDVLKSIDAGGGVLVFLQPASEFKKHKKKIFYDKDKILKWQNLFLTSGYCAYVVPQIHRILGEI